MGHRLTCAMFHHHLEAGNGSRRQRSVCLSHCMCEPDTHLSQRQTPHAQTCTLVTHLRIWEKNVRKRTKRGKCYDRNHRTSFTSHLLCVGLADIWGKPGLGRKSTPQSPGEATVLRASEQHMPGAAESSRSSKCHGQIL